MRAFLFLTLLLMLPAPIHNPQSKDEESPVVVLSSKWGKSRLTVEQANSGYVPPAPVMLSAKRNVERNRRENVMRGDRDPSADTVDGRAEALEKSVQDSRASGPADGFVYRVKLHNANQKVIEILFWEYQFVDQSNSTPVSRRQFLCGVNIKPDKDKDVEAFSMSGPSDVVSVGMLSRKSGDLFQEKVLINRVEYADGSIWQRKGWHLSEVRLGYERAIGTPWGSEMCRGL